MCRINHTELLFPAPLCKISNRYQNFGYFYSEYIYLKHNNRVKVSNPKTPFYCHDLLDYIKNQNNTIQIKKTETKTMYQNILIHGAKNYTIFGETMWKNKIKNLNFVKIWRNSYFSYSLPHHSDLVYKLPHCTIKTNDYKSTCKCTRDKTIISPYCNYCKQTENILTAPEYKKYGNTNHTIKW